MPPAPMAACSLRSGMRAGHAGCAHTNVQRRVRAVQPPCQMHSLQPAAHMDGCPSTFGECKTPICTQHKRYFIPAPQQRCRKYYKLTTNRKQGSFLAVAVL
eukprot:353394-Chlamydomonas_euryale.AAC.17